MPFALESEGKKFLLRHTITLVGRDEESDLVISHRQVSRKHCVIADCGSYLFVRDLASTNGLHIDSKRVLSGQLHHGDLLAFGDLEFTVLQDDFQAKPAPRNSKAKPGTPLPRFPESTGNSSSQNYAASTGNR